MAIIGTDVVRPSCPIRSSFATTVVDKQNLTGQHPFAFAELHHLIEPKDQRLQSVSLAFSYSRF